MAVSTGSSIQSCLDARTSVAACIDFTKEQLASSTSGSLCRSR